jgi:hypothetical protein
VNATEQVLIRLSAQDESAPRMSACTRSALMAVALLNSTGQAAYPDNVAKVIGEPISMARVCLRVLDGMQLIETRPPGGGRWAVG